MSQREGWFGRGFCQVTMSVIWPNATLSSKLQQPWESLSGDFLTNLQRLTTKSIEGPHFLVSPVFQKYLQIFLLCKMRKTATALSPWVTIGPIQWLVRDWTRWWFSTIQDQFWILPFLPIVTLNSQSSRFPKLTKKTETAILSWFPSQFSISSNGLCVTEPDDDSNNSRSILNSYFFAHCHSQFSKFLLVSVFVKLNKSDYKNWDGNAVLISIPIFNPIQLLMRDWTRWWLNNSIQFYTIQDQFSIFPFCRLSLCILKVFNFHMMAGQISSIQDQFSILPFLQIITPYSQSSKFQFSISSNGLCVTEPDDGWRIVRLQFRINSQINERLLQLTTMKY